MTTYTPPAAEIAFVINRLIGLESLAALPGYESVNAELLDAVIEEAGKVASEVFAPLNTVGDKQGVRFQDGAVTMPPGFKEAYKAHVDGGWNAVPIDSEQGGQGLPWLFSMAVQEMWQSANAAFTLITLLNQGATELLLTHGSESLKAKYLPNLVSGTWGGTMNITEPQAGSDVGAIASKAVPEGDRYRVYGQKIFISYGDHDLTDNIIHFVLARLPGAPEGTRGLSLFLVPKILVNDDGSLGAPNDVRVVSVEHKMGQHVSPTCVMAFGDKDGALGWLVGAEHGGIAAMFTMMNNARVGVGVQALGLMERSRQNAVDYARTRIQSRDILKPKEPPVPIIRHPDVRRMLMAVRSATEAARALAYSCAACIDFAKRSPDPAAREAAKAREELLTPLVKAWITDFGSETTSVALQVCGGMGYVQETGMAQHVCDGRVLSIYEGANGIHAGDLVFRKIVRDQGAALRALLAEADEVLAAIAKDSSPAFKALHRHLGDSVVYLRASTAWILQNAKEHVADVAAIATPFLRLAGNTVAGFYLIKSAWIAQSDLAAGQGDPAFLTAKIATAHFYAEHVLPLNAGLAMIVTEGAGSVRALPEEGF